MAIEDCIRNIGKLAVPAALAALFGCRNIEQSMGPERNLEVLTGKVYGATRNSQFNDIYRFDMREELNRMSESLALHKNIQDPSLKDVISYAQAKIFEQKGEYSLAVKEYDAIKTDQKLKQKAEQYKKICLEFIEASKFKDCGNDIKSQLEELDSRIMNSRMLAQKYEGTEYEDNAKKLNLDWGLAKARFIAKNAKNGSDVEKAYFALMREHTQSHLYDDIKIELARYFEGKSEEYARDNPGTSFSPEAYIGLCGKASELYQNIIRFHPETNSYAVAKTSLRNLEEKRKDKLKNH